jgi:hypothetical protein
MDKNGVITITDWQKGMADSAILGIETLKGTDVFENPGTVRMANAPELLLNSLNGTPVAYVQDTINGADYTLTQLGTFYYGGTVVQSGLGTGWDLLIHKDYVWISAGDTVSLYGPLSNAPSWLGTFQTRTDNLYYGKLFIGRDDIVYIGNGNTIASVQSFTGALPTVMPSGTYNSAALTLQYGYYATTMAELGKWLMIGTQKGSSYNDFSNYKFATVFPWDRTSTSFENPIKLNEAGVQAMIPDNNKLYIVAGTHGNVYVTDTTNYSLIKQIPWISERPYGTSIKVFPNAIAFNENNNLLVGLSTWTSSFSTNYNPKLGIYEIQITKDYPTNWRFTPSTGGSGVNANLDIGFILPTASDSVIFGYRDGNNFNVDTVLYNTLANYETVIESQLYVVGSRLNQKAFKNIEFTLSKPLNTSQQIEIAYRKNVSSDYRIVGTYTFANLGAVISHVAPALIDPCEIIQFRIRLTQTTQSTGVNINLISVRVW